MGESFQMLFQEWFIGMCVTGLAITLACKRNAHLCTGILKVISMMHRITGTRYRMVLVMWYLVPGTSYRYSMQVYTGTSTRY